ncbi:hypothetical protein AB0J28_01925 [Streptosporangium canum]|uniref:hypothetical protein n=1 Tax=Streptosporangium canum TaxID=324952 RepID=UPI0034400441
MAIIEGTQRLGDGLSAGRLKAAVARYDFAVDGGAIGVITLRGDTIPAGAIITDALIDVTTALAGATATMSVGTEGAADVQSATVVTGAPYSTTGAKRLSLTSTTAPVKTTAKRNITATIATAGVTAGKFSVIVWYIEVA